VLFKPEGIAGIFSSAAARERKPEAPPVAVQTQVR